MKRFLLLLAILLPLISYSQFKVPDKIPGTYVFDYDKKLSDADIAALNGKLIKFRNSSSIEIAVVVLSDLQGIEIEDAANQIFRTWGIGKKELNNGVLFLVSPDNRKARIEVGYGLEGDLPDTKTDEIQEAEKPFFRAGDWSGGINAVVDGIITTLKPISWEQRTQLATIKKKQHDETVEQAEQWFGIILGILVGIGIGIYILRKRAIKKRELEEAERLRVETEKKAEQNRLYNERLKANALTNLKKLCESASDMLKSYMDSYAKISKRVGELSFGNYISVPNVDKQTNTMLDKQVAKAYEILNNPNDATTGTIGNAASAIMFTLNSVKDISNSIESQISNTQSKINSVATIQKLLPDLFKKANAELKNTPYDSLKKDTYNKVLGATDNLFLYFDDATGLQKYYNSIIGYKAEQERLKAEQEEEERRRKKQREEEEEEEETRRRNSYSSSSYGSSYGSSYDSGSSSSSFGFGGGSSGGGGSSSSW